MQPFDAVLDLREAVHSFPVEGPDAASVTIPDAHFLFHAEFKRAGSDLTLTGQDGHRVVVPDYFKHDKLPTLFSSEGSALTGDVVAALAGSVAPGQYAQAGGAAPSAPPPIGRVAVVQGNATAIRNGVAVTLNVGDAIYKGDVIQTQGDSKVGVIFGDGTTFNLGADARMVLNDFVYNPAPGSANSALINLVQGSITFIAGEVAHTGDMKVSTPVATMGIRGTAVQVDINVNNGQTTLSVLIEPGGKVGSFYIYSLSGQLIGTVDNAGNQTIVTPAGPLDAVATEVQKTAAELQAALLAVQNAFQTQAIGQAILAAQPVPPSQNDPNAVPKTQIQPTDLSTSKIAITDTGNHVDVTVVPPPNGAPPTVPLVLQPLPPQPPLPVSGPAGLVASNVTLSVTETQVATAHIFTKLALPTVLNNVTDGNGDVPTVFSISQPLISESDPSLHIFSIKSVFKLPSEVARYEISTNFGDAFLSVGSDGRVFLWSANGDDPFKALGVGESATINFNYTVTDKDGHTSTANVEITVNGTNDRPDAHFDNLFVTESQVAQAGQASPQLVGNVLSNDSDVDGDHLVVHSVSNFWVSEHKFGFSVISVTSVAVGAGEVARYDVETNYGNAFVSIGTDGNVRMWAADGDDPFKPLGVHDSITLNFSYTADDGQGLPNSLDTTNVSITVNGSNDAPAANTDSLSVSESQVEQASSFFPRTIGNVLSNDSDVDGDNLTVTSITAPTLIGLSVTITSETAHSDEVKRYKIDTATGDAHIAVERDGSVEVWSDSGEDPFRALGLGQGATISFTYTVSDGHGGTDTATASIRVNGTNDAPHASNDSFSTTEPAVEQAGPSSRIALGGLLGNDSDPDNGDTLSVISVSSVSVDEHIFGFSIVSISSEHGTGEVARYDIKTNSGDAHLAVTSTGAVTLWSDSSEDPFQALGLGQSVTINFNYTVSDGHSGGTDTASASIRVNGTNDAPTDINFNANLATLSSLENSSTLDDHTSMGTFAAVDPDSTSFTYKFASGSTDFDDSHNTDEFSLSSSGTLSTRGSDVHTGIYTLDVIATDDDGASKTVEFAVKVGSASGDTIDLSSSSSKNIIYGLDGNDTITGGNNGNFISGGSGSDTLKGGTGNDVLVGGSGADTLTGGGGSDTFMFRSASDSTHSILDTITDFNSGSDIIDLSGISGLTAIQGATSGFGSGASLHAHSVAWVVDSFHDTIDVYANVTNSTETIGSGSHGPDMQIHLTHITALSSHALLV